MTHQKSHLSPTHKPPRDLFLSRVSVISTKYPAELFRLSKTVRMKHLICAFYWSETAIAQWEFAGKFRVDSSSCKRFSGCIGGLWPGEERCVG